MADLYLRSRKLSSIFELLGTKENNITYSIGWALAHSPSFLAAVLRHIRHDPATSSIEKITLQEHGSDDGGFTDIEVHGDNIRVILEAKRGWTLPSHGQLSRYASRLRASGVRDGYLVVMSECTAEYARLHLMQNVDGYPVHYLGWKDIHRLADIRRVSHIEMRLLQQLRLYIERIVKMQNQESNLVYVLSLGQGCPSWSKLSWIDIVKERRRYFHPVGGKGGWPKEPPNYLGFRYHGKLQSIHHVDDWKIITDIHAEMPELNPGIWEPHFLYTLGDPIYPSREVKSGRVVRSMRVWSMLDLLLTSKTISDARDLTDKRMGTI